MGIDLDPDVVEEGRATFPQLEFYVGDINDEAALESLTGTFDYILLVDTLGAVKDCQTLLQRLHRFCTADTRLVLVTTLIFGNRCLGLPKPSGGKRESKRTLECPFPRRLRAIADLADFDTIKSGAETSFSVQSFRLWTDDQSVCSRCAAYLTAFVASLHHLSFATQH